MLFPAEQTFVGRDEKRAPLKTTSWEASTVAEKKRTEGVMHVQSCFACENFFFFSNSLPSLSPPSSLLFNEKCSVQFLNISTSIIRTPLYGGPFYGPSPPQNFLQC